MIYTMMKKYDLKNFRKNNPTHIHSKYRNSICYGSDPNPTRDTEIHSPGFQVKTAGQEDEEVDGEDVDKKSKVILISID